MLKADSSKAHQLETFILPDVYKRSVSDIFSIWTVFVLSTYFYGIYSFSL